MAGISQCGIEFDTEVEGAGEFAGEAIVEHRTVCLQNICGVRQLLNTGLFPFETGIQGQSIVTC